MVVLPVLFTLSVVKRLLSLLSFLLLEKLKYCPYQHLWSIQRLETITSWLTVTGIWSNILTAQVPWPIPARHHFWSVTSIQPSLLVTCNSNFYQQISSVMPTFIDNKDEDKLNLLMNNEQVNQIADIYVTFTK